MKKIFSIVLSLTIFISIGLFTVNPIKANALESVNFYGQSLVNAEKEASDKAEPKSSFYGIVFVNFSDTEKFSEAEIDKIKRTYSGSPQSVDKYFLEASNGKYSITANFLGSVTIDKKLDYFKPKYYYASDKYNVINEQGYDSRYFDQNSEPVKSTESGAKRHIDRLIREQELVKDIISALNFEGEVDLDSDKNKVLDGISFIINTGSQHGWDDILWPHRSMYSVYSEQAFASFYVPSDLELKPVDFLPVYINGCVLSNYTVFTDETFSQNVKDLEGKIMYSPSTICHEYMHDLNLPDYYPYLETEDTIQPVGELDIMGVNSILPSMPLTYTRYNLGWVSDENIIPIEKSGRYTLSPVTDNGDVLAYKLVLGDYHDTGEYFMIEARSNKGSLADMSLSGHGITIYKINESQGYINPDLTEGNINFGNMYGEQVYVYRLGNLKLSSSTMPPVSYSLLNGQNTRLLHSQMSRIYVDNSTIGNLEKSADRSVIDQSSRFLTTSIFYKDGTNSGIKISNVTFDKAKNQYSFDIQFDELTIGGNSASLARHYNGRDIVVNFDADTRSGLATIYCYGAGDYLKYKDGAYRPKKAITPDMLESGELYGSKLISKQQVPVSYLTAVLDFSTDQMAAIFVAYGDTVLYAGTVNAQKPTFIQYLFGTTRWMVIIISLIGVCVVAILGTIIYIVVKSKKPSGKKERDVADELSQIYGDNYWMVDEFGNPLDKSQNLSVDNEYENADDTEMETTETDENETTETDENETTETDENEVTETETENTDDTKVDD